MTKKAVIVMGVAASGKTTIGRDLASRLGCTFADADDFHPEANIAKMRAGSPLSDADRSPWLAAIATWISAQPGDVVVTCSALKRAYRDRLRAAGAYVWFLHLDGPEEVLAARIAARTGHFMPASLLTSQLATLEPLEADEPGMRVEVTNSPRQLVETALLGLDLVAGQELRTEGEQVAP